MLRTTAAIGEIVGAPTWAVRRLYELGLMTPAALAGRYRLIDEKDIPRIEELLREKGYLKREATVVGESVS